MFASTKARGTRTLIAVLRGQENIYGLRHSERSRPDTLRWQLGV